MATNKAVLFAVDDQPDVLAAIVRDLRRAYGERYRIVRAGESPAAVEAVRELKLRGEEIALFLADQRMPEMSGVEFLREAMEIYPDARRVILTGYADKESAIQAINEVKLDHYLTKPWDPPEEALYPILDDLLEEWEAEIGAPYEGIRIVGHRWSAHSHEIRDFVVRNLLPYRWLDVEEDEEATQLVELAGEDTDRLPLVFFPDGSHLVKPSTTQLAAKLGLKTRPAQTVYDLVIVGGGPAGLAGAVYGASEGLTTLLIEGEAPGGQAGTTSRIENYLGFPRGLSGRELTRRATDQVGRFGVEILTPLYATGLRADDPYRFIHLSDGTEVSAQAVLIATGVSYRLLEVPGMDRLHGAGVYYGSATSEASNAKDRDVFIIGGGNSAGQAAVHLARVAKSVTILIRGESLSSTMSHYLIEQIGESENITLHNFREIAEVHGEESLQAITVKHARTGDCAKHDADALFIFIGAQPRTDWVGDAVLRDSRGFILSGLDTMNDGKHPPGWTLARDPYWLETSLPGVFAAGDVRHESIKRIASAVGEGSMAIQFVHRHLASL